MKNFITYLLLIVLILGCVEEDKTVSKEIVNIPPKNESIINWAFFNTDGLQNISFPIWFNDSATINRNIKQIHLSVNEFETSEDSTFHDTVPSTTYEVSYSKGGLSLFYVVRYSEEIKIEEQWFRYRKDKDSLGYSIPSITNNVIYEENDFLPIFSTLQNAQQYKRLEFLESDSATIQYLNTLSTDQEKHVFITDSSRWNVHFIDQRFTHPENNTFYYGEPSKYIESFRIKNLVEKEALSFYKYFSNDCIYQYSTFSNGFENRRTFLYDKDGLVTGFIDSLMAEPNNFIESTISKIDYTDGLPKLIASYKSQDSLLNNPIKEIRFNYEVFGE